MTDTDGSAASEVTDLLSEKELQLVRSRASICRTCYLLNTFAGNFCGHGNSKSDAFFVAGPARRSQPLGEYCVRRAMHRDHDCGDPGGWHFYIVYGLIEIALTALIVWYAWIWPRQAER